MQLKGDSIVFDSGKEIDLMGKQAIDWHPQYNGGLGAGADDYPHFSYDLTKQERRELADLMQAAWDLWALGKNPHDVWNR